MNYKELLLGCGSNWQKKLIHPGTPKEWQDLVTMDINPDHKPNLVWDLEKLPLPFEDNTFDEIHAYEVLEHVGTQGDYKFFFAQFEDLWRILKPNGLLIGTAPMWNSVWAWGDPSHKRVIQRENFVFLDQEQYKIQVGKTPMSDFRYIYHADYTGLWFNETAVIFSFVLRANKPSRR